MTYEEMKQEVYNLDLESMAHGIKVKNPTLPERFEVAGYGITKLSCIVPISQADYVSDNMWAIYVGKFFADGKSDVLHVLPAPEAFEKYLSMLKDIKAEYLKKRAEGK